MRTHPPARAPKAPAWYGAWRTATGLWVGLAAVGLAFAFGGHLSRGGLRPCDRLDRRICNDLGADGCAVWTTRLKREGAASTQPHRVRGRGAAADVVFHKVLGWDASKQDNPGCYEQLEAPLYPAVLNGIRLRIKHVPAR